MGKTRIKEKEKKKLEATISKLGKKNAGQHKIEKNTKRKKKGRRERE